MCVVSYFFDALDAYVIFCVLWEVEMSSDGNRLFACFAKFYDVGATVRVYKVEVVLPTYCFWQAVHVKR